MGKFFFREMERGEQAEILPRLFHILHTNMSQLAPTGYSYAEDRKVWIEYIETAVNVDNTHILLMFAEDTLAGYGQYSVEKEVLAVDEVEIVPRYQRTMLFYRFCQYMMENIPPNVRWFESYVHKDNANSISVHESLGMERIGENKRGTSWHYRGEIRKAAVRLGR